MQQFEEYQANPEQFLKLQAERKQKDELRKAAKLKSAQEKEAMKSSHMPVKVIKNVLTRMQSKDLFCFAHLL